MSKKESVERVSAKKELSLDSIRDILWDEIHLLRTDGSTPAKTAAITNASGKIMQSVALELKYAQIKGDKADIKMLK